MHLFNPQSCLDIADGKTDAESPAVVREKFDRLGRAGSADSPERDHDYGSRQRRARAGDQAVITRNLYRLWFSLEPMMGINGGTWLTIVGRLANPRFQACSPVTWNRSQRSLRLMS